MDDKDPRCWNTSTFTAAAQLEKPTRFFFLTRLQLAPSLCFSARQQSCCSCSSMSKSWGEGAKVRKKPKDNKQKVSLQKGFGWFLSRTLTLSFFVKDAFKHSSELRRNLLQDDVNAPGSAMELQPESLKMEVNEGDLTKSPLAMLFTKSPWKMTAMDWNPWDKRYKSQRFFFFFFFADKVPAELEWCQNETECVSMQWSKIDLRQKNNRWPLSLHSLFRTIARSTFVFNFSSL